MGVVELTEGAPLLQKGTWHKKEGMGEMMGSPPPEVLGLRIISLEIAEGISVVGERG